MYRPAPAATGALARSVSALHSCASKNTASLIVGSGRSKSYVGIAHPSDCSRPIFQNEPMALNLRPVCLDDCAFALNLYVKAVKPLAGA